MAAFPGCLCIRLGSLRTGKSGRQLWQPGRLAEYLAIYGDAGLSQYALRARPYGPPLHADRWLRDHANNAPGRVTRVVVRRPARAKPR
jgi:hypothetical protein